jgi:hypothetical protein
VGSGRSSLPRIRFTLGQIMLWAALVAFALAVILHPENPVLNLATLLFVAIVIVQVWFAWVPPLLDILFGSKHRRARPIDRRGPLVEGEPGLFVAYASADGHIVPVELLDLQFPHPQPLVLPSLFLEYEGDRPMLVEEIDDDLRRLDLLDRGPILGSMDRRWPVLVLPIATAQEEATPQDEVPTKSREGQPSADH